MDKLMKIYMTMKSFEGRMKALEKNNSIDFKEYCDKCSSLEHDFYEAVKSILKKDEGGKANVSSAQIARYFGLIDDIDDEEL